MSLLSMLYRHEQLVPTFDDLEKNIQYFRIVFLRFLNTGLDFQKSQVSEI